jgi:hypothetical protein
MAIRCAQISRAAIPQGFRSAYARFNARSGREKSAKRVKCSVNLVIQSIVSRMAALEELQNHNKSFKNNLVKAVAP